MRTKQFWIDFIKVTVISLIVFICVSPVNATAEFNAVWCQPLVFFTITYFLLDKYVGAGGSLNVMAVGIAVALGRIIIELPLRVSYFCDGDASGLYSLILTLESLLAIFMACVCWTYKKPVVFLLTLAIFILINSFIPEMWSDFLDTRRGL